MEFCSNKIIDVASDRGSIYLGVWDTLNVRQQQFDVSAWLDAYGDDGVLTVLNQRRTDDLPYEVADVTLENGVATWTFDETDTAIVGEGKAALVYVRAGETIARTVPIATYTAPTIGMSGSEPPDPWESWYTRILEESAAAQQAAAHAGVSASNAADAAASAYTQATQAATARSQAVEARNEARSARDEAQTARGEAVTAAGTATTAAGTATGAAENATTAASGAVIAQGKAEDAQSAAETAQGKAEDAQAAAEAAAAQAQATTYVAFATEGAADVLGFKTTLGADGIPLKAATVTQTSGTPTTWTIRRLGKNHFSRDSVTFKIGYLLTSSGGESANNSYMYTETYIPVLPNTEYVFSGIYPPGNAGTGAPVSCYRADKSFIERKSSGLNTNPKFTTPPDCRYIRFNCPTARDGGGTMNTGNKIAADIDIQIEIGATATVPAAYAQKDYTVPITALDTPTEPTETPTTLLGDNVVLLLARAGATATMDITARLDPTLVYKSLRG